jgi:hypothetical protein
MVVRVKFNAAKSSEIYNLISQNPDRTPATTPHSIDIFEADGITHLNWYLVSASSSEVVVEFRHPTFSLTSYGIMAYFGYNTAGDYQDRQQCYAQHYGVYKFEEADA